LQNLLDGGKSAIELYESVFHFAARKHADPSKKIRGSGVTPDPTIVDRGNSHAHAQWEADTLTSPDT